MYGAPSLRYHDPWLWSISFHFSTCYRNPWQSKNEKNTFHSAESWDRHIGSPSAFTAASSDSSWRIFSASTTAIASSRLPTLLLWEYLGTGIYQTDLGTQMQCQDSQEGACTKPCNKLKACLTSERNHEEYQYDIYIYMMHLEKVSCNAMGCYMNSILAFCSATTTIQAKVLIKRHLVCKLSRYGHVSMGR